MAKISITYRATIDRYVPVMNRARASKQTALRSKFFIFRERTRVPA